MRLWVNAHLVFVFCFLVLLSADVCIHQVSLFASERPRVKPGPHRPALGVLLP